MTLSNEDKLFVLAELSRLDYLDSLSADFEIEIYKRDSAIANCIDAIERGNTIIKNDSIIQTQNTKEIQALSSNLEICTRKRKRGKFFNKIGWGVAAIAISLLIIK